MRIMQFITELAPAGAERVVCELGKYLKRTGHEVSVVSLMPLPENPWITNELRNAQITVHALDAARYSLWPIGKFRKIIMNFKPHVVHSHLIHANIFARFARMVTPVKFTLINTVHIAERRPGKWWHFILDRLTYSLCDQQTAVSIAVRDFHSAKIVKPPENMPVIYNGLPMIGKISHNRINELRDTWAVADCSRVLGSVGRLDWQKGYDILLEQLPAISKIIPAGETWGLVILGEGNSRNPLEKIAARNQQKNIKVVLPGFHENAAQAIGAFDLFVMPSRYEGFGLTLVEAMMQGVPILAADVDSLPELIAEYRNGQCVDFMDVSLTVQKIREYANLPVIDGEYRFSVASMSEKYLRIYLP